MFKKYFCLGLCLSFMGFEALAQTVQITEIAPHTLAQQPEWFEFKVSGVETVDMNNWQISNGSTKPKLFAEQAEKLVPGAGSANSGELEFKFESEGYFYFSPSPIGLPNDGGTIQILDGSGKVLNEASYPKTKSRSTKDYEEREVWTWSDDFKQFLPQLVRAPQTAGFEHSRGRPNSQLPTPLNQYSLLINEASPDNDLQDFIELYVAEGPSQINLQYVGLKHNGTTLWQFDDPFLVAPNDYLQFKVGTPEVGITSRQPLIINTNAKDGLSAGSGTVELVGMSNTSLEQRLDTVCWQDETLSQTEQNRVEKFVEAQDWQGSCIEIKDLIDNESVARTVGVRDSNTSTDWFRHFNGSAGTINEAKNQPPQAIITVQGSKKTEAAVPFFLNVSGEDSVDPDGKKDLANYEWIFNQKVISNDSNPAGFHVEAVGEFVLQLKVTDQSGATSTAQKIIMGFAPGRQTTSDGSAQAKAQNIETIITQSLTPKNEDKAEVSSFLNNLLAQEHWTEQIIAAQNSTIYPDYETKTIAKESEPLFDPNWKRKVNLPKPVRSRMKKNLGVLFSWREAPWPDLEAEWTAVVAEHRKFEYFGAAYLGF